MGFLADLISPQLHYGRLGKSVLLREPRMEDFAAWKKLRQASRAFLQPWEPTWRDDELLLSSFRRRVQHYAKLAQDDQAYPFFIFNTSGTTLLGGISLSNLRRGVAQVATLGYWMGHEFANQGYMSDAMQTVTQFARDDLALHRLEAACLPHNTPSIRLLQRAEFDREGYAKNYLMIAGHWEDHVLWGKIINNNLSEGAIQL